MTPPRGEVESVLAKMAGRRHCLFTGRASTAIYLSLATIGARRGAVVIPSTSCLSPATAARLAGHEVIYCDVTADDFGMSPLALEAIVTSRDDIVAVVPIHLYGAACRISEICGIARAHGIPVIEDAAQALGASCDGKPAGGWGDTSVFSFGHTKIVDVGHGGALLTDDDDVIARARALERALPYAPGALTAGLTAYREAYYGMRQLAAFHPRVEQLIPRLAEAFPEIYLFRVDDAAAARVSAELDSLSDRIATRLRRAEKYEQALWGLPVLPQTYRGRAAPWRFSFLMNEGSARLAGDRLRGKGFHASHWYPAQNLWSGLDSSSTAPCPNAERIGARVINLWLGEGVTDETIEATCAALPECIATAAVES